MAAARAHRRRAALALAPLGLHPGQELLLSILAKRGSATQVQLARILGVEPPTIAKMVGRLEAAGFAERMADPRDARAKLVSLTDQGRDAAAHVGAVWAELSALTAAGLTPDEAAELTRLLTVVADRLGRDDLATTNPSTPDAR
ncbi:MarR family winged helix-turn-helix transcriptional regulator [Microcella humidisoli]|uniref:MarR family transcriptional regulator n=1 Tax=Microcella humidisoli TaxID=2963406 RepID=A0ABY5FZ80_9MICO|nr:MarR family transcriptional regulator [Microcella humidisoli]UTT63625.1 MarR family transcriptional regulator [Microcella humidisoli]